MVSVVEQRIAELWTIQRRRELTPDETVEFAQCLDWLTNDVWKRVKLENLSLLASMTNDTEWQFEICRRIDELDITRKKPGPKAAD